MPITRPLNALGGSAFVATVGGAALGAGANGADVPIGVGATAAGTPSADGATIPDVDGAVSADVAKPVAGGSGGDADGVVTGVCPSCDAVAGASLPFGSFHGKSARSCRSAPLSTVASSSNNDEEPNGELVPGVAGAGFVANAVDDAVIAATAADVGSTGVFRSATGGAIEAFACRNTSGGASRITVASLSPSSMTASREMPRFEDEGAGGRGGGSIKDLAENPPTNVAFAKPPRAAGPPAARMPNPVLGPVAAGGAVLTSTGGGAGTVAGARLAKYASGGTEIIDVLAFSSSSSSSPWFCATTRPGVACAAPVDSLVLETISLGAGVAGEAVSAARVAAAAACSR